MLNYIGFDISVKIILLGIILYIILQQFCKLYEYTKQRYNQAIDYISKKYNIDVYENERLLHQIELLKEKNQKLTSKNHELKSENDELNNRNNDSLYYFYYKNQLRYGYRDMNSDKITICMYSNKYQPYYIQSEIEKKLRWNTQNLESITNLYKINELSIEHLKKCKGFLSSIDVNVYNDIMSRFLDESNIIYLLKLTLHDNTIIFKVGKTTQCLLERIKQLRTEKHDKNIVYKSIIPLDIYLVEDDQDLSEIENYFLNKMNQEFSHILDNEYYGGFENQIIDKFSNIKNSI